MKTFNYEIKTTHGEAFGTLLAKNADAARARLAKQYEGQLADEDDNPLNNEVESIELVEVS